MQVGGGGMEVYLKMTDPKGAPEDCATGPGSGLDLFSGHFSI